MINMTTDEGMQGGSAAAKTSWTGPGSTRRHEVIAAEPAAALAGVFDLDPPGREVPIGWHTLYLLPRHATSELGEDGHAAHDRGDLVGRGTRRMFAGGSMTTYRPLRFGEEATRETYALPPVRKEGRSGPLTFVTVRHRITQGGRLAIHEDENLVYLEPVSRDGYSIDKQIDKEQVPGHPHTTTALTEDTPRLMLDVDEKMLFRFSAVTYNAHRIHYDRTWCEREGYPGLVIHGPLMAMLVTELARRNGVDLTGREYTYRIGAAAFGNQRITAFPSEAGLEGGGRVLAADGTPTVTGAFTPCSGGEPGLRS